jgi:hypothetical protein
MSSSGAFSSIEYPAFSPPREVMYDLELSRRIVTVKFFSGSQPGHVVEL